MNRKSTFKILVIDDEADMLKAIRLTINVQEPDWDVIEADSVEKGLAQIDSENPDLVLLDLRMPRVSGFDVLKKLRLYSNIPVIVLTVESDELIEVKALEIGADDFITKPFGNLELIAHIRSVLRRAEGFDIIKNETLKTGNLEINFNNHSVNKDNRLINLTSTEFAFLELLSRNKGQVIPFEVILGKIWGQYALENRDYLKVYIRKLRVKLEDDPSNPQFLKTVNGLGYKFTDTTENC